MAIFRETAQDENDFPAAMDFSIVHVGPGQSLEETDAKESAWVLLSGSADLVFEQRSVDHRRSSLFDEPPTTLHVGPNTTVKITGTGLRRRIRRGPNFQ